MQTKSVNQNSPSKFSNRVNVPVPSQQLEESNGKCRGCKLPAIAVVPKTKFHEALPACQLHFNSFLLMDTFLSEREKIRMYVN